jgi:hypothetical protein
VFGFTYGPDHLTLVAVDAATGHPRWHVRMEGLSLGRRWGPNRIKVHCVFSASAMARS